MNKTVKTVFGWDPEAHMNKPIQEQPEVMQAIKFDMLADWLRKQGHIIREYHLP